MGLGGALALSAIFVSAGCAGTAPASPGSARPASASAGTVAKTDDSLSRGGASLFVVHLMSDFDAFEKYFEEGQAARAKAGIQGHLLSRLDDGRAVVHLFADDAAKVEQALESPEMEKYLDRKGAPESSLVWITGNELVKAPSAPPLGQTYSLYLKLRVTDFEALAQGFERDLPLFAAQGVIAEGLHRSTSKQDIVILHFVGTSRDKLDALPKRPEFAQLLANAGSKDELKPLVGVDISRSRPSLSVSSQ
jgi:hypothetical protein